MSLTVSTFHKQGGERGEGGRGKGGEGLSNTNDRKFENEPYTFSSRNNGRLSAVSECMNTMKVCIVMALLLRRPLVMLCNAMRTLFAVR